jgi:peptidoglycan/LPS O-acetylase OafA/YrhL
LIASSWEQYARFPVFILKRSLRIFPGLLLALLVTIFILGLYSDLPYGKYIANQDTLSYLNNLLLINTHYSLPGVFTRNIYPNAVNGSLWTLAFEFLMYLVVGVFGVLKLLKRYPIVLLWSALLIGNLLAQFRPRYMTFSLFYLDARLVSQLGLLYFSGVLLHLYKEVVRYPLWASLPSLIGFAILSERFPAYTWLFGATLLSYGVLGVSGFRHLSWFGKFGDFSYGIYVYSFPIQQTIWHHTQTRSPIRMFALALVLSLACAVASWYFVEKPCVGLKKRIRLTSFPLTADHSESA